jgi:hypothetical protein
VPDSEDVGDNLVFMTTSNNGDPIPPGNLPTFLVAGSQPGSLEEHVETGAERPDLKPGGVLPGDEDAHSNYTIKMERYTRWLMIATLFSIFCTGWIVWSIKEFRDLAAQQSKYINDSFETTRYAIFATNRHAEAMEKANDLAAETSRNQLRAYVSLLAISTQNPFEKNMSSSFSYKNVGQTPALSLRTLSDAAVVSPQGSDVKPPRTFPASYDRDSDPTIVLGAGVDTSDSVNKGLALFKETELVEFRAGSKIYVVWGVIYYADVFGKAHYTRFCRYFKNDELNRWSLCKTDNDSN